MGTLRMTGAVGRLVAAAKRLCGIGQVEFTGVELAKEVQRETGTRLLMAHGTLYRVVRCARGR